MLKLERTTLGGLWAEPILVAKHKSCEVHLAKIGNELNIQYIESKEEGKGHASLMIKELLGYCYKNKLILVSSTPLSPAWKHLCEKYSIKAYL